MSTPIGSSQWMYATGAEATQQSLKFNDDESQYLSWTPAAAGNRKTWTWSGWVKRGNLGIEAVIFSSYAGVDANQFRFSNNDTIGIYMDDGLDALLATNAVYRDASAWYHLVLAVDTTQATASNRLKLYVNGEQVTSFSTATYPPLNHESHWNQSGVLHTIADNARLNNKHLDGYLSDVYFIDGQALDASSFGQFTNGYWEAKDYAGTYGTNGFHLTFQDDVVSEGFNAVTYRGNGSANGQSISGLGFQPDWVWIKIRNGLSGNNVFDSVRGATYRLYTNGTAAEDTLSGVTSFDADGFTLGSALNGSGYNHVAWNWDAGSGSPVSNTDGSIASTVKASQANGFSIVTWTATTGTVGHGLGTAPELIIEKRRSSTSDWIVGTTAIDGSNDYLRLNTTVGKTDSASASPTATVFTPNTGSGDVVAYCFHSVAGYSSIGSFTGTGAAGNAVNCGFRPAWLLVKDTTSTGNWFIYDNTRSVDGTYGDYLRANLSDAEGNFDSFVATSTGFETLGSALNTSGNTFIYMAFADTREAAFWKDVSGQGNHWTPNNLDYRDSLIDSPANNFAAMNPLLDTTGNITFSEGNLKTVDTNASTSGSAIAVSSGKWFAEMVCTAKTASNAMVGICTVDGFDSDRQLDESLIGGSGYGYVMNGSKLPGGAAYGATWAIGDVIGIALDLDSAQNTVTFYKNGSSQGAININNAEYVFCNSNGQGSSTVTYVSNFGQDSTFSGATTAGGNQDDNGIGDFAYAPPSGYLALCTANLPTPTIVDGSEHFNTVLYTGDGTSSKAVTGTNHTPDFLWFKKRSGAESHHLGDTIRGASQRLVSNTTAAETTESGLVSFDSDGFTISGSGGGSTNDNGATYAAWSWKAGGTAVSNTDGSITSQVSANTTAGFSIVSYTGTGSNATVGHGLGVTPDLVIVKNRDFADNWRVWSVGLSSGTHYMNLNGTSAEASNSSFFTGLPTSSVFQIGTDTSVNRGGDELIAYCFANTDTTKAGSYTGNGSTDGPFVYTGFRPAWVMIKSSTTAQSWEIRDDKREPFNDGSRNVLFADSSGAETVDAFPIDFTSNGFKLRNSGNGTNASGATFIFLAFAENPFKYANAR